jgi:hypothetical protein
MLLTILAYDASTQNKETKVEKTWKPAVAGILNIIGGVVLFIVGTLIWSVYIGCEGYRGANT